MFLKLGCNKKKMCECYSWGTLPQVETPSRLLTKMTSDINPGIAYNSLGLISQSLKSNCFEFKSRFHHLLCEFGLILRICASLLSSVKWG